MKLTEPQALNRIASYCSRAERCEHDIRKKLLAWEVEEDAANRIVKRLKDERFVSDERFARSFINDKMRFNKWGRTKIVYELRKRSIGENIYNPILDEYSGNDFEEQLLHILGVKMKSVKGKDKYDIRNKLMRFALSRGFSMDMSIKCINKVMDGSYEEDFP